MTRTITEQSTLKLVDSDAYPRNLLNTVIALKSENKQCIWTFPVPEDINETMDYLFDIFGTRPKRVLKERYENKLSYSQISRLEELSRERVRQIVNQSLRKLIIFPYFDYLCLGRSKCNSINLKTERQNLLRYEALISAKNSMNTALAITSDTDNKFIIYDYAYDYPINQLPISVRAKNALLRGGYEKLKDIVSLSIFDILDMPCIGEKTGIEIIDFLESIKIAKKPAEQPAPAETYNWVDDVILVQSEYDKLGKRIAFSKSNITKVLSDFCKKYNIEESIGLMIARNDMSLEELRNLFTSKSKGE